MLTYITKSGSRYATEKVGNIDAIRRLDSLDKLYGILGSFDPEEHKYSTISFGDTPNMKFDGRTILDESDIELMVSHLTNPPKVGQRVVARLLDGMNFIPVGRSDKDFVVTSVIKEIEE